VLSALHIHGYVPSDVLVSRLMPIPDGQNTNITDSMNYSAIALSSVFAQVWMLFSYKNLVFFLLISYVRLRRNMVLNGDIPRLCLLLC